MNAGDGRTLTFFTRHVMHPVLLLVYLGRLRWGSVSARVGGETA